MPNHLLKKWHGSHMIALFVFAVILSGAITYYHWRIGLFSFLALLVAFIFSLRAKKQFEKELKEYVSTLSYRINKAGEETVTNLPIGMILYNEDLQIQWANPYFTTLFEGEVIGTYVEEKLGLKPEQLHEEDKEIDVSLEKRKFNIVHDQNERLLYIFDRTEEQLLKEKYERNRTVVGFIYLDNYDEVTQGMDDQLRSKLLSYVTTALNRWSKKHDILVRRTASD